MMIGQNVKVFLGLLCWWISAGTVAGFAFKLPFSVAFATKSEPTTSVRREALEPKDVVNTVAVAGATGQTGRMVIEELLSREVPNVVAMVRDMEAAKEVFPNPPKNLQIMQVDLSKEKQIQESLNGVDAMIWCATGFSSRSGGDPLKKAQAMFNLVTKRTIDLTAPPLIGKYMMMEVAKNKQRQDRKLPKVIMLSSAGVTRPSWSDSKKQVMPGAADIPIVRLNPFGALDIKRDSEDKLRQTGIDYCVVRPGGLKDAHPAGSRPVFSQGDVAVGRINRKDVAKVLVDCLASPEATGKTFEVVTIKGYEPPLSIDSALAKLKTDAEGPISLDATLATYTAMQQLLPGELQDAAALAMGQTYEQLDRNEVGRLGVRGQEDAVAAAPKPSG